MCGFYCVFWIDIEDKFLVKFEEDYCYDVKEW